MERDSIVIYKSFFEAVRLQPKEAQADIYNAVLEYAFNSIEPENISDTAKSIFLLIKPQIDANNQRYENGKKGGRPKKENEIKTNGFENSKKIKTKQEPNVNENVNDNDNENENVNYKNTMCKAEALALFERLWQMYPNKKGKGQVSETQKKRLLSIGEDALVKAIERYSAELKKDADWRKPQNGSTFFNSGYVDYLDENYKGGYDPESLDDIGGEQYESMFDRLAREKIERGEINVDEPEPEYPF